MTWAHAGGRPWSAVVVPFLEEAMVRNARWAVRAHPELDDVRGELARGELVSARRLALTHFSPRYHGDARPESVVLMQRIERDCAFCKKHKCAAARGRARSVRAVCCCRSLAGVQCRRVALACAASLMDYSLILSHRTLSADDAAHVRLEANALAFEPSRVISGGRKVVDAERTDEICWLRGASGHPPALAGVAARLRARCLKAHLLHHFDQRFPELLHNYRTRRQMQL